MGLPEPVSETEALQQRIAELEAENVRLRGEDSKALPSPESERVITPSESDIVPPGEQGKLYVGPVVGPDDHKARPKPVIDGEATVVPPASKSECPSWLRPVPKTERRIDGGPPVAKSSAETEAQRQRVNADRSIEYRVMGGGRPAEPWRGHAGGVDESFFWGGASGKRAW